MVTRPPVNKHQDRSVSLRERCEWMTRGPGSDEPPRAQTNPSLMATGGLFPELPEREGGAGDRACQESASLLPTPHAPCLGCSRPYPRSSLLAPCLPAPLVLSLQPCQEPAAFDKTAIPFDFCPHQISIWPVWLPCPASWTFCFSIILICKQLVSSSCDFCLPQPIQQSLT